MTSKRKVFIKTDLTIPRVEHRNEDGQIFVPTDVIPPVVTSVHFGVMPSTKRTFDFTPWYGVGIDSITYACHRQIERFVAGQDAEVSPMTVSSYCHLGLRPFLNYLVVLSAALGKELTLNDINRDIIDGYLGTFDAEGVALITKKARFQNTKSVLKALCKRGVIAEVRGGDNATFPDNPFPGAEAHKRGESPLSSRERKAFSAAVKTAVMPLFSDDVEPTSELLAYAMLIVALHTGRNTTPLLEMTSDCIRSHPKASVAFLVFFKRRGHSTSKVVIRESSELPAEMIGMSTLRPTVTHLVRRVIQLSRRLQEEAPEHLKSRIWLYRMRTAGRGTGALNQVSTLTDGTLSKAIRILVRQYDLKDSDGKPLRINVSRLRKTFVNRIFEILDGDIVSTAAAAGNTVSVTGTSYLRPGEDAQRNWKFLGIALTEELLTSTVGKTEITPTGKCSDVENGDYAPKREKIICTSFLNCVRCRNYVVTADDLYRLFSFYWRIFAERNRMHPKLWRKQLAHIVRIIDRDIVNAGLTSGVFTQAIVDRERERALRDPHPFWRADSIISDLGELSA